MDLNKKLYDLMAQRDAQLAKATEAHNAGNVEEYNAAMDAVKAFNGQIDTEKDYIAEMQRYADEEMEKKGVSAEGKEKMAERGAMLAKGGRVQFSADEIRQAIKSTTLATTTIAKPTEVGGIHAGTNVISSIIDQVRVVDLSGCGQILEAYEVADMDAQAGAVATLAGNARTASDPTFAYAAIKPFEVDVTSYVDRNLSRLTPLQYEATIRSMIMRSMRRKVCGLITNGDGQVSPDMFGVKNATNAAGSAIYDTLEVTSATLDADTLMDLVFAYGGNDELGSNARLYLAKEDLKAIGKLRGTNEKKNLFTITPDGNGNTGMISDGAVFIPYTIDSSCTALSTATRHATNDIQTMFYGDPQNYELGLFGGMTVRVSEDYKAAERMNTILGDCMVGGNLVVHKGMVVLTLAHGT